jgi:hypothetical protein
MRFNQTDLKLANLLFRKNILCSEYLFLIFVHDLDCICTNNISKFQPNSTMNEGENDQWLRVSFSRIFLLWYLSKEDWYWRSHWVECIDIKENNISKNKSNPTAYNEFIATRVFHHTCVLSSSSLNSLP